MILSNVLFAQKGSEKKVLIVNLLRQFPQIISQIGYQLWKMYMETILLRNFGFNNIVRLILAYRICIWLLFGVIKPLLHMENQLTFGDILVTIF